MQIDSKLLERFKFIPSSSPDVEDDQYVLKADECYHVQCHPAGFYYSASYLKDIGDNKVIFRDIGTFQRLETALKNCVLQSIKRKGGNQNGKN